MGLGVIPEVPLVVGRVFNYLAGSGTNCVLDCFDPEDRRVIYSDLIGMGVSITSNSYNDDSNPSYTDESALNDKLVRSCTGVNGGPPMIIYFSAGNADGNNTSKPFVSTPATAKNVITVGGSENFNPIPYPEPPFSPSATGGSYANNGNEIWSVGQHGPTDGDHRIKPDLVAPASAIESIRTRYTGACRPETGPIGVLIDSGSPVGQQHWWSRGTSFSAPLAAGAGALLYTWFKNLSGAAPTPALLKAAQITLARDLSGTGHPPDPLQGWGKADLERAFATDGRYAWSDEAANPALTVHQTAYLPNGPGTSYRIKDTSKPVRVTLVWTDAPGTPGGGGPALVNDLDLTVRMLGSGYGRYVLGNDFNFATGRSNVRTTGGVSNTVDNVEQAVFTYPDASADHFSVEVFGKAIGADGINVWFPVTNQQNFAVFIENAAVNHNGSVFLTQNPLLTVAAGAPYTASIQFQNSPTADTTWSEGPTNFYRLGSVAVGNPFGARLFLSPGEQISPGQSKSFSLSTTAPYAAGTYPFQWQMVEELAQFFGPTSTAATVTVTPSPYSFYTLTPCRIIDTRNPPGPYGAPALQPPPAPPRVFNLRGQCGIPSTATAVSVNVTAVVPSSDGFVKAFPSNIASPLASTLNYRIGRSRANNAILTLDTLGQATVSSSVLTDFLLDVNGYFQ